MTKTAGCFVALMMIVGFSVGFFGNATQLPQRSIASTITDKTDNEIVKCYSHFNLNSSSDIDFEPAADDACIDMNVDLATN